MSCTWKCHYIQNLQHLTHISIFTNLLSTDYRKVEDLQSSKHNAILSVFFLVHVIYIHIYIHIYIYIYIYILYIYICICILMSTFSHCAYINVFISYHNWIFKTSYCVNFQSLATVGIHSLFTATIDLQITTKT